MAKKQRAKKEPEIIKHESTIGGIVADAMSELECLGEEMREAFDNTPESLQNGGVGEARGQAADDLEGLSEPNVPKCLEELKVEWTERKGGKRRASRASRRDDAVSMLNRAVDRLNEYEADEANSEDDRSEAEQLRDEIENLISEAENVYFPGMFG